MSSMRAKGSGDDVLVSTVIPKRTTADLRKLALDAKLAFLLTQIDGASSLDDLTSLVGRSLDDVREDLIRLHELGAISLPGLSRRRTSQPSVVARRTSTPPARRSVTPPPKSTRAPPARAARSPGAYETKSPPRGSTKSPPPRQTNAPPRSTRSPPRSTRSPPRPTRSPPPGTHKAPSRPPSVARAPAEEEGTELEAELVATIERLHASLPSATHYDMLGVARDADKKAVKAAYFAYVAKLHPDRHFRKKLGNVARKMHDVFVRVTTAYETLNRAQTRAAYDRTLAPIVALQVTKPQVAPSPQAPPLHAPPESSERSSGERPSRPRENQPAESFGPFGDDIRITPRMSVPASAAEPSSPGGSLRPRISILEGDRASMRPRISVPAAAPEGSGDRISSVSLSGTTPNVLRSSAPRSLAPSARPTADGGPRPDPHAVLRQFFDERVVSEGRQRARLFTDAAKAELAKGNVIAAAAQFQLALDCCDTPEVRSAHEAAEALAQVKRFEINVPKGQSHEREGRWPEAAVAYGRAFAVKPEPWLGERLANALRRSSGDMRLAVRAAEAAVAAEPQNPRYRVTLAEVYSAAGLEARALSEAKRALDLSPGDAAAKELSQRLGKTAKRG
jgi:curved DNA-binding protein CbpA